MLKSHYAFKLFSSIGNSKFEVLFVECTQEISGFKCFSNGDQQLKKVNLSKLMITKVIYLDKR